MKITIKQNRYGNWNGYVSGRKVAEFGTSHHHVNAQQDAEQWLREKNLAEVEAEHGDVLSSLWLGHSRTALSVDTPDPHYAAALVTAAENRQLPVRATVVQIGRTLGTRRPHIRVTITARTYDLRVQRSSADHLRELVAVSDEGRAYLDGEAWSFSAAHLGAFVDDAINAGLRVQTL